MSVYTSFNQKQLDTLLSNYQLGEVKQLKGISDGITNTNYFLDTETGRYVLTVFEQNSLDEMPYFMDLMAFLNEQGIPCAHPVATNAKQYVFNFEGKPVAIVERLQGYTKTSPDQQDCAALGKALAEMHLAGLNFPQKRANDRGPHWWRVTTEQLSDKLHAEDFAILQNEIHHQEQFKHLNCPRGTIHADLFPDNTLFDDHKLTGIIDYYYACHDVLLYDVAVSVNAWCHNKDGALNHDKSIALLQAYHQVRPFTEEEKQSWSTMLRAAALRFWLSRLHSLHFPIEGEMTQTKNPDEMKHTLLHHIEQVNINQQMIAEVA